MDMKEKREIIKDFAELLAYKIRAEELSQETAENIMQMALHDPEKVEKLTEILYMDLPEDDTMAMISSQLPE